MSRARELADLGGSANAGGITGKNLIINGAMQVAQRGTSVTAKTNTAYQTVDRFLTETNGATYDHSQSTTVPSGQGFSYSLKAVIDGAFTPTSAQYFIPFEQRIEGQNLQHLAYGTSDAKSVTLSFWIRSSKTGTYVVEFSNLNSTQSRKYSKQYTINVADTWEYKTLTWEGDTVRSFDNTNDVEGVFYWWVTAGTDFTSGTIPSGWENSTTANRAVGVPTSLADNDEYYLTGVQLEVGEQATPFEHRSYQDELLACMRYFEGSTRANGTSNGQSGQIWCWKNDSTYRAFPYMNGEYRVVKRATPTVTIESSQDGTVNELSGYSSGTNYTVSSITNPQPAYVCMYFQMTDSLPSQSVVGYYEADAEL